MIFYLFRDQEVNQSSTTKASVSSEIISTQVQGGGNVSVNFTFIMADNTKIAMNTKRKFEAQVCCIKLRVKDISIKHDVLFAYAKTKL